MQVLASRRRRTRNLADADLPRLPCSAGNSGLSLQPTRDVLSAARRAPTSAGTEWTRDLLATESAPPDPGPVCPAGRAMRVRRRRCPETRNAGEAGKSINPVIRPASVAWTSRRAGFSAVCYSWPRGRHLCNAPIMTLDIALALSFQLAMVGAEVLASAFVGSFAADLQALVGSDYPLKPTRSSGLPAAPSLRRSPVGKAWSGTRSTPCFGRIVSGDLCKHPD